MPLLLTGVTGHLSKNENASRCVITEHQFNLDPDG